MCFDPETDTYVQPGNRDPFTDPRPGDTWRDDTEVFRVIDTDQHVRILDDKGQCLTMDTCGFTDHVRRSSRAGLRYLGRVVRETYL